MELVRCPASRQTGVQDHLAVPVSDGPNHPGNALRSPQQPAGFPVAHPAEPGPQLVRGAEASQRTHAGDRPGEGRVPSAQQQQEPVSTPRLRATGIVVSHTYTDRQSSSGSALWVVPRLVVPNYQSTGMRGTRLSGGNMSQGPSSNIPSNSQQTKRGGGRQRETANKSNLRKRGHKRYHTHPLDASGTHCRTTSLPPLCDIPSGCCSFTGPWTVTRSSLRMLRRVAAFCRPLRPVLLLVSFPRSLSPVVGVLGLC